MVFCDLAPSPPPLSVLLALQKGAHHYCCRHFSRCEALHVEHVVRATKVGLESQWKPQKGSLHLSSQGGEGDTGEGREL